MPCTLWCRLASFLYAIQALIDVRILAWRGFVCLPPRGANMSDVCGNGMKGKARGQDCAATGEAPEEASSANCTHDAHRVNDGAPTPVFRYPRGNHMSSFGGLQRRGGETEGSEEDEAVKGRFSFQKPQNKCSYASFLAGKYYSYLVPENTESAVRGLSEEELGQTGPYGSLLHLLVRTYGPLLFEGAADIFPMAAVSAEDEFGQTLLHALAAFGGRPATLELVLHRLGVEALAAPSTNGTLPLHLAARKGLLGWWPSAVLEAAPQEAVAPRTAQGANLLHFLGSHQRSRAFMEQFVVQLPMECLAERDERGRTPLHTAAASQHLSALPLVEAAPLTVLVMEDDQGYCPLELALLRCKATAGIPNEVAIAVTNAYVKKGVMDTKKEWRVTSPLHVALDRCQQDVIDALLACPQAREWAMIPDPVTGVLPIHFVVGKYRSFKKLEVGPLLELMAPEDVATPVLGSTRTALHLALINDDDASGMQLLDVAASSFDVDALDAKGRSLVMLGLTMGTPRKSSLELFRRVIDLSTSECPLSVANWRALNVNVDVSLLVAICSRYEETFFERTTAEEWEGGSTPLSCACYQLRKGGLFQIGDDEEGYRRDLASLLELVPEWFVTVRGRNGYTPLHSAAACGNAIAVELLLQLPSGGTAAEMVVEALNPGHSGTPLEAAMKGAHIGVVREFLAVVPGIRSMRAAEGETLAQLAESLHSSNPQLYREVKLAFAPAVKSAAPC